MPDNENSAPDNQDTPPPRLLAGKFKSVEEMENAYSESQRGLSHLSEENDRMQRYIALMDPVPAASSSSAPAPAAPDVPMPSEEEIPPAVKHYVRQALDERERIVRNSVDLEQKFYSQNPDLVGQEDLVLLFTGQLRAELKTQGRFMSLEKVMEEVAGRVRARLERIRSNGKSPPHVEGGSHVMPEKPGAPPSEESEDQRLQNYLTENRKRKTNRMRKE